MARKNGKYETYKNYFSRPYGLNPDKVRLRPLKKGSHVIGGTILGRIGRTVPRHRLPRGVLDPPGWPRRAEDRPEADPRRLEAARGHRHLPRLGPQRALRQGRRRRHVDRPDPAAAEAAAREARPLDERIEIYECGRDDIRSGQIDRRVLASLAYLAESGLKPGVTSLKCGHGFYTSSGNVSQHSSGNAVDIATVNGIPILGHRSPAASPSRPCAA